MPPIEYPITSELPPDHEDEESDDVELIAEAGDTIALALSEADCGMRLDKVLSTHLPQYSRSRIQQWIEEGHVTVDGKTARAKTTMFGDESLLVQPQAAADAHAYEPEAMALSIVHEDKTIMVIDKPAGLVVHPGAGNWSGTLQNGLLHYFPPIADVPRAGIVHRLDKDTSGLMVVAKTMQAQTDLVRQLQARTVHRVYLALVWGTPQSGGKVDAAIGRHPRERIKMSVQNNLTAKPAVTHYRRLASGMLDGKPVSLLRCELETGRTHQIRVHMQSLGFALVGDALYGKPHLVSAFGRQALHAYRLGLVHPTSRKDCEWQAPVPEDFAGLLERAGIALDTTGA
ncbi:MAG: RluA family pseudouridine synthase [Noviherbaspirillum sp.]